MRAKSVEPESKASTTRTLTRGHDPAARLSSPAVPLLQLQRTHGNSFVQRMLLQAQQAEGEAKPSPEVESTIQRSRGGGQPLDDRIRAQMEPIFGYDFNQVRVHTDAEAHHMNRDLNALAFTTGQDIFFREGQYDSSSASGKKLLAHELTHVVQQTGMPQCSPTISEPGDKQEQEAEQVAHSLTQMVPTNEPVEMGLSVRSVAENGQVQRAPAEGQELQSREATTPDKQTAQKALLAWQTKALNFVEGTRAWLAGNWSAYLGFTSSNPRLGWQEGFTYNMVSNAFGNALSGGAEKLFKVGAKKFAKKASAAAVGAAVGTAIEPGGGTVIGFVIGVLIESIASAIFDSISGKSEADEAAAQGSLRAAQMIEAAGAGFDKQNKEGQSQIQSNFKEKQMALISAASRSEVGEIQDWAVAEEKIISEPPSASDRSLYQAMSHDWILEHAGDEANADKETSQAQWKNALKTAKSPETGEKERKKLGLPSLPRVLPEGEDLDNHPEIFAYQTRGHWNSVGLPGFEIAASMIEEVKKLKKDAQNPEATVKAYFDNKAYSFTTAQYPDRLIAFLKEKTGLLPKGEEHIRTGQFKMICTLDLSSADGSVYVDEWEYSVELTGDISWIPWHASSKDSFTISPD